MSIFFGSFFIFTWFYLNFSCEFFVCPSKCSILSDYNGGQVCGGNSCLNDCKDCVLDCDWDDYSCQNNQCQCHANGCDQCKDGYFKIDYDYPCVSCQDTFEGCMFCSDFHGCQQCQQGYIRTPYNSCGNDSDWTDVPLYYCRPQNRQPCIENNTPSPVMEPTQSPAIVNVPTSSPTKAPTTSPVPECIDSTCVPLSECSTEEGNACDIGICCPPANIVTSYPSTSPTMSTTSPTSQCIEGTQCVSFSFCANEPSNPDPYCDINSEGDGICCENGFIITPQGQSISLRDMTFNEKMEYYYQQNSGAFITVIIILSLVIIALIIGFSCYIARLKRKYKSQSKTLDNMAEIM